MKTPRIVNAVGHIDDDLVSGATRAKATKKNVWLNFFHASLKAINCAIGFVYSILHMQKNL